MPPNPYAPPGDVPKARVRRLVAVLVALILAALALVVATHPYMPLAQRGRLMLHLYNCTRANQDCDPNVCPHKGPYGTQCQLQPPDYQRGACVCISEEGARASEEASRRDHEATRRDRDRFLQQQRDACEIDGGPPP